MSHSETRLPSTLAAILSSHTVQNACLTLSMATIMLLLVNTTFVLWLVKTPVIQPTHKTIGITSLVLCNLTIVVVSTVLLFRILRRLIRNVFIYLLFLVLDIIEKFFARASDCCIIICCWPMLPFALCGLYIIRSRKRKQILLAKKPILALRDQFLKTVAESLDSNDRTCSTVERMEQQKLNTSTFDQQSAKETLNTSIEQAVEQETENGGEEMITVYYTQQTNIATSDIIRICPILTEECIICYEQTPQVVIRPCGHTCMCIDCTRNFFDNALEKVQLPTCPMCRGNMTMTEVVVKPSNPAPKETI